MAAKKKPTKATKTKDDGSGQRAEVRRQMAMKKKRSAPKPDKSSERAEVRRQMKMKGGKILKRESEYSQDAVTRNPGNQAKARDARTTNQRFKPIKPAGFAEKHLTWEPRVGYRPNQKQFKIKLPLLPDARGASKGRTLFGNFDYQGAGSAANAKSSGRKNPVKGSPRPPDKSWQRAENRRNRSKNPRRSK